jgi:hypothetical protein
MDCGSFYSFLGRHQPRMTRVHCVKVLETYGIPPIPRSRRPPLMALAWSYLRYCLCSGPFRYLSMCPVLFMREYVQVSVHASGVIRLYNKYQFVSVRLTICGYVWCGTIIQLTTVRLLRFGYLSMCPVLFMRQSAHVSVHAFDVIRLYS